MKLQPIRLNPVPSGNARSNEAAAVHSSSSSPLLRHTVTGNGNNMDHRLSFLNHPDLFWRYGQLAFSPASASTYPPCEFQHPLPTNLACDPRLWNKEDVLDFLQWCEEEFDIPRFDRDLFQMNGRALCLLQKQDLGERCPGYGDVIHNVLGCLIRESYSNGQHLPQSPITPHFPITPSWCLPVTPQEYTHATTTTSSPFHNSVTSSPATSGDSQSGSPKQPDQSTSSAFAALSNGKTEAYRNGTTHSSNNYGNSHSDSDVSDGADMAPSPSSIPLATSTSSPPYSPRLFTKSSSGQIFFPSSENASSTEPNTNGRLLWDFLQQLLNDSLHRYSKYITWKNRDSGVFKIVDPPGLAKLWGIQKNHLSMNYDKMSRALRYYYRVNILRKVQGERHCYQFLRNPTELKSIKNISMLKHQISPSFNQLKVKPEPPEPMDESTSDDIGPTDLSINQNSNNRLQDPLRQVKVENDGEDFQYPQDLSVGPVQLQLNMEAREAFGRHSDSLDSANNSVSSQIQIKVEDTNS